MTTTLIGDVDGSEADETVNFSRDARHYEIDRNTDNAARLRASLVIFVPGNMPRQTPKGCSAPDRPAPTTRYPRLGQRQRHRRKRPGPHPQNIIDRYMAVKD